MESDRGQRDHGVEAVVSDSRVRERRIKEKSWNACRVLSTQFRQTGRFDARGSPVQDPNRISSNIWDTNRTMGRAHEYLLT